MFVFSRQTDILLRDNPWKLFQARKNDKRLSLDCACAGQDVCAQAQYFFSSPQAVTQQLGCCQAITRPQSLIHPCPCSSLCLLSLGSFWSSMIYCLQRTVVLKLESQIHGGAILERLRFNIDANFDSSFEQSEAVSCVGVLMRNWSFCNIDLSHLSFVGWQPVKRCEGALATLPLKMALHRTGLTGHRRLCTHTPARLDQGREEIVPHPLTLGTIYI